MKKYLYILLALVLPLVAVSCDEDRDSNPTMQTPSSFVLNLPAYAENNVYDLETSDSIILTTSQPAYGTTLSTLYTVGVSLDGTTFTNMTTTHTKARIAIDPKELNTLIRKIAGTSFQATTQPLYVRLSAKVNNTDSLGAATSNVIQLSVLPYENKNTATLPTEMYVVGSFNPSNWNWGTTAPMAAVVQESGMFYGVYYFDAGAMFKISPVNAWGQDRGYQQVTINDQASAGITGENGNAGDNLKVGTAGWYTVVVKVEANGSALDYTVTLYPAQVILMSPAPGAWDFTDAGAQFTVPTTSTGVFTSPAATAAAPKGARIGIYIGLTGSSAWKSELTLLAGKIHYRTDADNVVENWKENVGAAYSIDLNVGQYVELDFLNGTGVVH